MVSRTSPPQKEEYAAGRAVVLAGVAALGGFLFGFDTAVINGAVTALRADFEMGSALTGFTVASACSDAPPVPGWRDSSPTASAVSR